MGVPSEQVPSSTNTTPASQAIPIPTTTLKRPANQALSPEPPKHSPHIPRTPILSQGFQSFGRNDVRLTGEAFASSQMDKEDDLVKLQAKSVDFDQGYAIGGPEIDAGLDIRSKPGLGDDTRVETSNMQRSQPAAPNDQRKLRLAIQDSSRHKSKSLYFMLSMSWFRRWSEYLMESEADLSHIPEETFTSKIDNSDLFTSTECDTLRPALQENNDFVAIEKPVWEQLREWYGVSMPQHVLPRPTVLKSTASGRNRVLEVYPAIIYVEYESSPRKPITISLASSVSRLAELAAREFDLEPDFFVMSLVTKRGETLMTNLDSSLDSYDFRPTAYVQIRHAPRALTTDVHLDDDMQTTLPIPVYAEAVDDGLPPAYVALRTEPNSKSSFGDGPNVKRNGSYTPLTLPYKDIEEIPARIPISPPLRPSQALMNSDRASFNDLPYGATGLNNIGNTCFMNSALQCLSNTGPLTKYFLQNRWSEELNPDNPLGMQGEVAAAYADLILQLWNSSDTRPSSVVPRRFKSTIGRFNSTFSGLSQQDSQELLGFLVDGLHEDLNRIKNKPYVEAPDLDGQPEEVIAAKAWEIYSLRNDSIIVDLFQGQYRSRVECLSCHKYSVTFDPYMFLSVPIPDRRQMLITVSVLPWEGTINKLPDNDNLGHQARFETVCLLLPRDASIRTLKNTLCERLGWNIAQRGTLGLEVVEVYNRSIYKLYHDSEFASAIQPSDQVFVVELGHPDWDAFEVPPNERIKENVRHVPVYFLLHRNQAMRLDAAESFGIPLMIALPSVVKMQVPKSRHADTSNEFRHAVGAKLYRVILDSLRRHLKLDVLQNRHMRVEEYCQDRSVSEVEEALDAQPFTFPAPDQEDMPRAEIPIADLFTVGVAEPKAESRQVAGDFYHNRWKHETFGIQYEVYNGEKYLKHLEAVSHFEDGDSTDADDEASDSDPLQSHSYVRAPRSPVESLAKAQLHSRRSSGSDDSDNDNDATELKTWAVKDGTVMYMEWKKDVAAYFLSEEAFQGRENPQNQKTQESFRGLRTNNSITLQECFDEYRKEEVLGDDNSWYCPQCKEHRPTKKKLDIWTVPEILVFHLKRFSSAGRGYRSLMTDKIDVLVEAPLHNLDLSDIVVGKKAARAWRSSATSINEQGEIPTSIQNDDNTDKTAVANPESYVDPGNEASGMTLDTPDTAHDMEHGLNLGADASGSCKEENDESQSLVYDLFAVSNHYGALGGGHYTACAKNPLDDQWYLFDDSHVSKTTEEHVMSSGAYLLFYQRKSPANQVDLSAAIEEAKLRSIPIAREPSFDTTFSNAAFPSTNVPYLPLSCDGPSDTYGRGWISPATSPSQTTRNNSPWMSPDISLEEPTGRNSPTTMIAGQSEDLNTRELQSMICDQLPVQVEPKMHQRISGVGVALGERDDPQFEPSSEDLISKSEEFLAADEVVGKSHQGLGPIAGFNANSDDVVPAPDIEDLMHDFVSSDGV
ncbi:hypothetical protein DFS34DRAFT_626379 [Phlyctochytrium arcticum]|nr:hypothetical protein DFS34DRAFT_626379 [Phlyctochytrium arcticum]